VADQIDIANEFAADAAHRAIAAARAAAPTHRPFLGTCHACLEEEVPVLTCGGMLRCTPCRAKWEKRR
jgi:hypothetical protein